MNSSTQESIDKTHGVELLCACGYQAIQQRRLEDVRTYSIAQYPDKDPESPAHFVFDQVTPIEDQNGARWLDFNGGAEPICPTCIVQNTGKDKQFRNHDLATCAYVECVELRDLIAKPNDSRSA